MKKQKGIFLVEGAILIGAFLVMVTALHKTETERAEDLKNKQQTEEVKK